MIGFSLHGVSVLPILRGAHLPEKDFGPVIGQYRDFFSAAVTRNPVINIIGSIFSTSDIPG